MAALQEEDATKLLRDMTSSMASSIRRRLFTQSFFCVSERALTSDGMAIAASKPMMATTIMISTSVKPDFLFFFIALPPFGVVGSDSPVFKLKVDRINKHQACHAN